MVLKPIDNTLGLGPLDAKTRTKDDMTGHETFVVEGGSPPDSTFYHELCHARTNELGFKEAELETRKKRVKQGKSKESNELDCPLKLLGEAYADAILYAMFRDESREVRSQLIESFGSIGGLRIILKSLGAEGIGQAAQFRVSLLWSGDSLSDKRLASFAAAVFGGQAKTVYDRIFSQILGLSSIIEGQNLKTLSRTQIGDIVSAATSISRTLTSYSR